MGEKYEVRNVVEDIVEMALDECLEQSQICRCPKCRADVQAFALNEIPPRYVVSEIGDLLVRANALSNQNRADIVAAITKAIMAVEQNPRHEHSVS